MRKARVVKSFHGMPESRIDNSNTKMSESPNHYATKSLQQNQRLQSVDPRCPGSSDGKVAPWAGWRLTRPQRMWLEAQVWSA
eukprot:4271090-Amphidinium_carterae.1